MKKLLLCFVLITTISLFLVACNNNNDDDNNNNNNDNEIDNSHHESGDNLIDDSYQTPDFTEQSGFKINVSDSLSKQITYDNIFLIGETTAQLDILFSDDSVGTLLVDTMSSTDLEESEDAEFIGDILVTIEYGDDGINIYSWKKDEQIFSFYSSEDLKGTDKLKNLIEGFSIEIPEND